MRYCPALLVCVACLTSSRILLAEPAHLPKTDRIPVLAWSAIPQSQTSDARYRELADCGFTIGYSSFSNVKEAEKAIDAAHSAGIQVLVSLSQLATDPRGTVLPLMNHPGLAGYYIRDEPPASDFANEAKLIDQIRAVDRDHLIYVNLLPDYATPDQTGVPTYPEYVNRFVATVPSSFLSFDYYPIEGRTVRASWYANLGLISDAARKANKPFWAFALSVKHFSYPAATIENLREEVYSNLAYGAQGIEYFTYWHPGGLGASDAPIDENGNRTAVYDRVQQMNLEIRALSPVFLGSHVESLGHTGAHIPSGTTPYHLASPLMSLKTEGDGAIVTVLARDKHRFLIVVNRDFQHSMPTAIEFEQGKPVQRVEKDATLHPLDGSAQRVNVDPGDALIFTWSVP